MTCEHCGSPATTTRLEWRWGDRARGESMVVEIDTPYCARCAAREDDRLAEGAAEAAGS